MEGTGYTKIYIFTKLPDSKFEFRSMLFYFDMINQYYISMELFLKFKSYYLVCTYICVLLKPKKFVISYKNN